MTEPRILAYLLSISAGANTYAKIAKRRVCTIRTARENVTAACRLGFVTVDRHGVISLTAIGAGVVANTLMGSK